ncbi:MAG: glycosyltransferase family 39 protein [Anaerolineales bacterium]|nr:glycosyltransferase family 39 protein [Anaerolineales bacterium]
MKAPGTNKRLITLPTIILLTTLTRLIGITSRPIWYDEAFSILFSQKGLPAMLYGTLTPTGTGTADIHPLGYYFLLGNWMKVLGDSILVVRLLSIFAGVATVFVAYHLARELFDVHIANIASIFLALAPFQVHYSQEIRMYSFLALWLLIVTYAYRRATTSSSWGWWVVFSISAALAQYTHNLAAFFLTPLALWPLLHKDWKNLRAVTLAGLGALLLYLPWLIHLPAQFAQVSDAYWVERPGIASLFTLLLVYVTNLPLPNGWLYFALFLSLAATAIAMLQTFSRKNRNPEAKWLMHLSFAPPILLLIVSQWIPVYIERALLPSGTIFCIWLSWALFGTSLPKILRNALVGTLILGAAVGLYQHVTYRGFPYAPFQELNISLRERILPGDRIIHASKATRLPTAYYDSTLPQEYIADPPGSNTDTLAAATQQVLGLIAQPNIASATGNAERIWFIVLQRHIDAYIQHGYENHPYLSQLEKTFSLKTTETWGDLRVYLFVRPPQ